MRSEFEKNRYWIGLYRSDVDFDETLGEFGRYVANGSRKFDAANLESFNDKWEAYANAWQHQQSKVDELQASYHGEMIGHNHHLGKVKKERDELQKRVDAAIYLLPSIKAENDLWGCDQVERQIELLEQALKGGEDE